MGKDKKRMGMLNFGDVKGQEPLSDDGEKLLPDEVFEEISIRYFNEAYRQMINTLDKVNKSYETLQLQVKKLDENIVELKKKIEEGKQ